MTQTTTYHHSRGGHNNQHPSGATITQSPSDSAATVELKTTLHELRQTREEISDEIKSLGPIPRRKKQSSSERREERGTLGGEEEEEEAMAAPKKRTRENRDSGGSLKEDPDRKRSKRMFGNLVLGTLQRSKTDLLKTRDRETQRNDLLREAETKAVTRNEEIYKEFKEKYWGKREALIQKQIDLDVDMKYKQRELYRSMAADCEREIANGKLRTEALPRVFWKPKKETIQTQSMLARQPGKVEEWLKTKMMEVDDGLERIAKRKQTFEEGKEMRRRGDDELEDEDEVVAEELKDADADDVAMEG
ncbi:unnamed protein product [Bathycoccus prasinos]|jgi:hypothetical protein